MTYQNPRLNRQTLTRLDFGVAKDVYTRVIYHCDRLGIDRSVFIQLTVSERVRQLDEQEAYLKAQKAIAKGPRVGNLPTTSARGLEVKIETPAAPPTPTTAPTYSGEIPEKLSKSFKRYSDFIEGSEGNIDRSIRLQTCLDDLKERAKTPQEAHAAFLALQKLLKERAALRPPEIVAVPDDVPVTGDLDE